MSCRAPLWACVCVCTCGVKHNVHSSIACPDRLLLLLLAEQNMTPEELEAHRAKRSALAKRLWQDPEYAARTLSALQAAGRRRRSEKTAESGSGSSSSGSRRQASRSSSSSRSNGDAAASASSRRRGAAAAAAAGSSAGSQGTEQAATTKARQPTQKVWVDGC